jgi:hypothetical protein
MMQTKKDLVLQTVSLIIAGVVLVAALIMLTTV